MSHSKVYFTYNATVRFDGTDEPMEVLWEGTDTNAPQYSIEDDEQTQIFDALMDVLGDRSCYKGLIVDTVIMCTCAGYMEYSSYESMDGTEYESEPCIEWYNFNILDEKDTKFVLNQVADMNEQMEEDSDHGFKFT